MVDDKTRHVVTKIVTRSPAGEWHGFEPTAIEEGLCRIRMPYRAELADETGSVDDGALAALIDMAGTAAAWSAGPIHGGVRGATVSLQMTAHQSHAGGDLEAEARIVADDGGMMTCAVTVEGPDGASAAEALVTYKMTGR